MERPFSYLVPVDSFPRRIEVLDRDGKLVKEIAHLPLLEGLPTGNDAVAPGVRDISWRADAPATLVWAEAQDGGDPARKVDIRDIVQMQAAPFDQSPVTLAKLGSRYAGAYWANGGLALVEEFWWKTRQVKEWRVSPDQPSQAPVLVREGSSEDRYRDPGTPATMLDEHGEQRLIVTTDGQSIYRLGEGASPQGDRPFIDRVSLQSGQSTRLFQSQAPYYEDPQVLLDAEGTRALISRESPTEPTNFYVRELASNGKLRELTHFPNPLPQLKGVKKEQIRYKRKDGVELTATLYLPPTTTQRRMVRARC